MNLKPNKKQGLNPQKTQFTDLSSFSENVFFNLEKK